MNIEIVEFYPKIVEKDKHFLRGYLHIYLIDLKMDIRMMYIQKVKSSWKVFLPFVNTQTEEGGKVRLPLISFTDPEMNKSLIKAARIQGVEYIKQNFKELLE